MVSTMRALRSIAIAALALFACDRDPSNEKPSGASPAPSAESQTAPWANGKTACALMQATWAFDGFVGVTPAGSASAAALNAQINEGIQTIRIQYTANQIKMKAGSQISMSTYTVLKDSALSCKLQNGNDTVVVTFFDADHCMVDRTTNPYAARMKLKRIDDGGF